MKIKRRIIMTAAFSGMVLAACGGGGGMEALTAEEEDALRVCASGPTVKGIDVSTWDGQVDWTSVQASGRHFAFIRVSDGLHHHDGTFDANWAGAQNAGLLRGAYQYFRASQDPIQQADLLIEKVGQLGPGDLPAVMDIEETDGASRSTIAAHVVAWLDRVEQGTGQRPIIYTAGGLWPSFGHPAGATEHKLWVANYGARCPYMPTGWAHWTFWQYSSVAHVPGIRGYVDVNYFNGTLSELRSLAGM